MYSKNQSLENGETSLTIVKVHPLLEGRTVRMYDVVYDDGTEERLSEAELQEFEN